MRIFITEQGELNRMNELSETRRDSLAARLKAGNRAAATELVDIYYERIYLYMRRLGHSCQVSEDLTQESFLRAWQHIGQLRSTKALNSWLYRVAGNVSRLYWRRHKTRELIGLEGIDVSDGSEPGCDKAGRMELLDQVKTAVMKLPESERQVIMLRYFGDNRVNQVAEILGRSVGTVTKQLSRAHKHLRNILENSKNDC